MTDSQSISGGTLARPNPPRPVDQSPNEGGYLMFEATTAENLKAALENGTVDGSTKVYISRGVREGEDSREEAIHAQAAEDDREGTRYAATTGRYFLEGEPKKTVKTTWSLGRDERS